MKHIRALDEDLEPVDVDQGEYHNGPRCAVCWEIDCRACGHFDTAECPGIDLTDLGIEEVAALTEQLHRYAALAERTREKLTTVRAEVAEGLKQMKRFETGAAVALRGHALAEADAANALYREKLALAQVAELRAELTALRNAEQP